MKYSAVCGSFYAKGRAPLLQSAEALQWSDTTNQKVNVSEKNARAPQQPPADVYMPGYFVNSHLWWGWREITVFMNLILWRIQVLLYYHNEWASGPHCIMCCTNMKPKSGPCSKLRLSCLKNGYRFLSLKSHISTCWFQWVYFYQLLFAAMNKCDCLYRDNTQ